MNIVDIIVALLLLIAVWTGFRKGNSLFGRVIGVVVSVVLMALILALLFTAFDRISDGWAIRETFDASVSYRPAVEAIDSLWNLLKPAS
jgi:divalent metal cation (Fe/Co/Zn/Cd) transporter